VWRRVADAEALRDLLVSEIAKWKAVIERAKIGAVGRSMTKPISGRDPNPSKPAYTPPPGACDAHCHIFGPAAKFPYAPRAPLPRRQTPRRRSYAPCTSIWVSRARCWSRRAARQGQRRVLDAIAWSRRFEPGGAGAEWRCRGRPDRARARGAARGRCARRALSISTAPGRRARSRVFGARLAMIEPLAWHAVFHFDAEDIEGHEMLSRLRVPFVIDHMGRAQAQHGIDQKPFRTLLDLMRNELAWVKIERAGNACQRPESVSRRVPFAAALLRVGPERVLWGTDFPHPNVRHAERRRAGRLLREIIPGQGTQKNGSWSTTPPRLYWADDGSCAVVSQS